MNKDQSRLISSSNLYGFDEVWNSQSLDDLVRIQSEVKGEDSIPSSFIIEVLKKELSSKILINLNKNIHINSSLKNAIKELPTLLNNVPSQLYYFMWSLKNSGLLPVEGIISSFQIKKSIFYLTKYLIIVELGLQTDPGIAALYEKIGLAYFDLAGIAQFSIRGLLINGKLWTYTALLTKAITCFQYAIKIEANKGKKNDSNHLRLFNILDYDFSFKENRTNLYVNPWHFLYIASALQLLNDTEVANVYLQKACLILNSIDDHQNPKIVAQKDLLEAVYNTIKNGHSIIFDLDPTKIVNIDKKLKRIRKYKGSINGGRFYYNPLVDDALEHQLLIQKTLLKEGVFNAEQINYLQSVVSLYKQVPSSIERDKLIYRLNIPPIKISGNKTPLKYALNKNPRSFRKIKAASTSVN